MADEKAEIVPDVAAVPTHTVKKIAKVVLDEMSGNKEFRGEKGCPGIPGDKGERGPKGEKGDQGEMGVKGPQGPQGIQGEKGEKGNNGTPGTKGDKGDAGPKGDRGGLGERGATGDMGPQGLQGPRGAQGPKGEQGSRGERGEDGVAGSNISCRARCTKGFTVNGSKDERQEVEFDAQDGRDASGHHSCADQCAIFQIVHTGMHYLSATVFGADEVRIIMRNDAEAKCIAIGRESCSTIWPLRKYDKITVEVRCDNTKQILPIGSASPSFSLVNVSAAGVADRGTF